MYSTQTNIAKDVTITLRNRDFAVGSLSAPSQRGKILVKTSYATAKETSRTPMTGSHSKERLTPDKVVFDVEKPCDVTYITGSKSRRTVITATPRTEDDLVAMFEAIFLRPILVIIS
jgi:hypothetical protein